MARGRSGEATREQLLTAAERLFGERGVAGVSLRQVAVAAGSGNHSALQYHFGDRDGLVHAIFERRMTPLNLHRLELLDAAPPGGADVPFLVRALVEPFGRGLSDEPGGSYYARFVAATMADPVLLARTVDAPYMEGLRRVAAGIAGALRECPPALCRQRIQFANTLSVEAFAQFERARDAGLLEAGVTVTSLTEALCASVTGVVDPPSYGPAHDSRPAGESRPAGGRQPAGAARAAAAPAVTATADENRTGDTRRGKEPAA